MTTGVGMACGEVAWERAVLAEAGLHGELEVARRYVDVAGMERDARTGRLPAVIIMSPALRGFLEAPVKALSSATHVIVLLDSIRPPWLLGSGLDCREVDSLDIAAFVDGLAGLAPPAGGKAHGQPFGAGVVTVFMGVSGGSGTSSLAHLYARSRPESLLVEGDCLHPSLAFLLGRTAASPPLAEAMDGEIGGEALVRLAGEERALTLTIGAGDEPSPTAFLRVVERASRCCPEVIVDAGSDSPFLEPLLARCDRLVVVTPATPLGIVRVCSLGSRIPRPPGGVAVIANRARNSAIGGPRWTNAVRTVVERETGLDPVFVADDVEGFDRAWLSGDWQPLGGAVPHLLFTQS